MLYDSLNIWLYGRGFCKVHRKVMVQCVIIFQHHLPNHRTCPSSVEEIGALSLEVIKGNTPDYTKGSSCIMYHRGISRDERDVPLTQYITNA